MQKTYKRETAGGMLVCLYVLMGYGVLYGNQLAIDAAEHLTAPVFLFAAGAFGMDALAKQLRGVV